MILDYNFNKYRSLLSISYTKPNGGKGIKSYSISKFKSYIEDPNGKYINWNGNPCSEILEDGKLTKFSFLTFMKELPKADRDIILSNNSPAHYSFDIEVECGDEFPEPSEAKFPILTISIVNPRMDCLVLGTKYFEDPDNTFQKNYEEYLNGSEFYRNLNLQPKVKYIYFENESDMLQYFLKNIVAKVPVLMGWNSIGFDWRYITTRIKEYFPEISINCCSMNYSMTMERHKDFREKHYTVNVPQHTLVLDMMDIIDTDFVVMPQKESLALDYIGSECPVKLHKIQYTGNLQQLYENDYPKYVFYNAIDSALVQLIDMAFGTLGNFEMQAHYCECNIKWALSKIALTEVLFFNHFYENGIKVAKTNDEYIKDRPELLGAYVREPTPGRHKFVCCNDFASLYPSTIITCNLSIENYMGSLIEGNFTENDLIKYRQDKNYFVSVDGSVYKNDKDYAFRIIQRTLKSERGKSKYLSKQLDATVISDIDHLSNNIPTEPQTYNKTIVSTLKNLGYDINNTHDLVHYDLHKLKIDVQKEIRFLSAREQAIKILMNSMYGGSSHIAFYFFNIRLANDITAESRNLIHLMESHIPEWFKDNWLNSKELHKQLGIEIKDGLSNAEGFVELIYGDTDSLYISYEKLLKTIKGYEGWSKTNVAKFLVDLNEKFLNDHNKEFMTDYYKSRHGKSIHEFELETVNYAGVWIDVKKRYSQILLWKDGKYYDEDKLPMKTKGLEIVKSSYPKFARNKMQDIIRILIEHDGTDLIFLLNKEMQKAKSDYYSAPLDEITPSISVNKYFDYVIDDSSLANLKFEKKTPASVKGLAYYNALRQQHNLPGEPDYNGKHRWYTVKSDNKKNKEEIRFCYQPSNLPKWAEKYAPVDRGSMFTKMVLDPVNRILGPCGLPKLSLTGEVVIDLFGDS